MTPEQYESQKRECWLDFSFTAANAKVPFDDYKRIFNSVYDRAFALGKQAETITQEEIVKAATHYACMGRPGYDPAIRKAYIEGAIFVLNS